MIDLPLLTILLLTGFINLIGALAYAARIAGVRTRRIAMSFALFNILVLFSRTSNSFLGPFLAKRIETRIHDGSGTALFIDMQFVLAAASVATLVGILLVPTGLRLFAAAIYVNFFAHHWLYDIRWFLFAATALLFWRCQVWFRPLHVHRRMPLLVGWGLVALFLWFAENIGTFARAWTYPSQNDGWHMVGLEKLGSWYLLMIISFVLVSLVQRPRMPD